MIGGYLSHSGKLTFSSTGLIKMAGPSMNWWSISHVVRSSVNLKEKNVKNMPILLWQLQRVIPKTSQTYHWGNPALLTHGEGVEPQCCPQHEPYALECRGKAAEYIWSEGLFLRTSQSLSPRPQDLVSKRVKEQVEGYLLLPSSMRKGPAHIYGLSWWLSGEESPCQYRRREFDR